MTAVPTRREDTEKHRCTEKKPYDCGGRDYSDTVTSQSVLRIAGSHQKLRRGEKGFFPGGFRGSMALPSDFRLVGSRMARK